MMLWEDRFEQADRTGQFTDGDRVAARSYNTCKVGEALGVVPTEEHPSTEGDAYVKMRGKHDAAFRSLGMDFYDAVCANNIAGAKHIADEIDRLVASK